MADTEYDPDTVDDIQDQDEAAAELEAMKQRVKEMEAEAAKLRELQAAAEQEESGAGAETTTPAEGATGEAGSSNEGAVPMEEDKEDVDARSIYVGNVDYGATPEEIQGHFAACGQINRVTILCDKFTGHPKGFAYVEFAEAGFVTNATVLDDSVFRGRIIKVTPKRTNIPGFNHRGRGRGRGRGQRGGYGFQQPRGGRGYRGRGRGY